MVYRPNVDERLCFVLMPFKEPFDDYYLKIIQPAAKDVGLYALRADDIYGNGIVIREIWDQIWFAKVVIADVTEKNPNVNYELGLCHSLGVPTILITRRKEDVPFDYLHRRYILYDTDEVAWDQTLRESLRKTLEAVLRTRTTENDLPWPYDTEKAVSSGSSLLITDNPREIVLRGATRLADRIARALGPTGRVFSVALGNTDPLPQRKGLHIAQGTRTNNPLERRGISQLRHAALDVDRMVGDGTKTCMLLTQSMAERGNEALKDGFLASDVIRGMKKAVDCVLESLTAIARPVPNELLLELTRTAAGDRTISTLITTAMEKVGKDGVITIEESIETETVLEVVEGMQFDSGYLSPHFVTEQDTAEIVLSSPYILVRGRRLSSMRELLPLLEQVAASGESLLIIAEDVEGEALETLVVNKLSGTLKVAAVKAPGFGDRRSSILEDISILTGANIMSERLPLEDLKLSDLGQAKNVIVDQGTTTIVEGAGEQSQVANRIKALRRQIDDANNPYERERLAERLAMLVGGVAVIKIGGISQIDILDRRQRTESALHSARSAIQEGWVVGGGLALTNASKATAQLTSVSEADSAGIAVVTQSLGAPIKALIENANASPTQVMHEISEQDSDTRGFNVETKQIEDLVEAGIVDSKQMLRVSVEVAFVHAKSLLETEDWDLEEPKPSGSTNNS